MIHGLQPRLAEGGKIKIGGLGEARKARGSGNTYRLPMKLDHFIVTTAQRNKAGDLIPDEDLMRALPKDKDGKLRALPIILHSDVIEEVFPTTLALYSGKRLVCRGDGKTATRWEVKGNRKTGRQGTGKCPCEFLPNPTRSNLALPMIAKQPDPKMACKMHGTLHCSILAPDQTVAGSVHKWRTTSMISIQHMLGSIKQVMDVCGTIRGVPLWLKVEPVAVTPPGAPASTVYCCHLELRSQDIAAVQRKALDAAQMRRALGTDDPQEYKALLAPPAADNEPEIEQAEVQHEFQPDYGTGNSQGNQGRGGQ